jgi:uracil-DNA glycosylase
MKRMVCWEELKGICGSCNKCLLSATRTNVVLGRGNVNAPIMLIGEGPGEQEDLKALPFVGPAGNLLDLLLKALGINEEQYYIANVVKCRPPGNRVPLENEAEACLPYLRNQVLLVKPQIIVCLGATAIRYIVDKESKITQIRGRWIENKGYWIMPTFHPAALLRDESKKILVWEDFKKVKQRLEYICQSPKD